MPERRPYLAANWKMNKTIEEAEASSAPCCRARRRRRRGRDLPAVPGAARRRSSSAPRAASGSRPRTCTRSPTAPSPARSRRRCCSSSAWTAWSSATPSAASTSARPTRRSPARCRRRSPPGLEPILCVGETEQQRDQARPRPCSAPGAGRPRRGRRRATSAGVVIAYEPVWAIGTGRTATPEQAQEACCSIRDLLRDRDEGAAERVRILYGGSVKPDNAAELIAPAGHRRRAGRRGEPRPGRLRGDRRRRA